MSKKLKVTVRLTSEVTHETTHSIDLDEFLEWSNDGVASPEKIKEFIESARDYDVVLDELWERGLEVANTAPPFPDIERVIL